MTSESFADYCDRIRNAPVPAPNPRVIVPCSGAKLDHRARARDLYTGRLFQAAWRAGEGLIRHHDIAQAPFILSAKHGIVPPWVMLDPYDCTWDDADQRIGAAELAAQVAATWDRPTKVFALMPAAYVRQLKMATFGTDVDVRAPLAGLGIGEQLGLLKRLAEGERPASEPATVPVPRSTWTPPAKPEIQTLF